MKQIASNYAYSPATNVVTLTGVNIDQDQLLLVVAPQVGRTMYNFASGVTGVVSAGANTRVTLNASTAGLTTTSPLVIFYDDHTSTQTVAGTVTANDSGALSIVNSSTVTKADVKFTAIAGAYNAGDYLSTYSLRPLSTNSGGTLLIDGNVAGNSILSYDGWAHVRVAQSPGSVVTVGSLPAISGTVTANNEILSQVWEQIDDLGQTATKKLMVELVDNTGNPFQSGLGANSLPISGTVTANNPSGALTTRFGSVTTANLSQLTTCVTNTSRKYLLAQNISAGTVTIGIGFSPTTTQGIQLPAGGGLTFDAFCPTGAVYWLGAVTGAAYTILEG